ncbi:hypothetical protein IAT40_006671 [Kwoniella sp. CBS 6097]
MSARTCSFSSQNTDTSCSSMATPSESASTSVISPSIRSLSPISPISEIDMNINLASTHCLTPYPDAQFPFPTLVSPDKLPSPTSVARSGSTIVNLYAQSNQNPKSTDTSDQQDLFDERPQGSAPCSYRDKQVAGDSKTSSEALPSKKGDQTARPPQQRPYQTKARSPSSPDMTPKPRAKPPTPRRSNTLPTPFSIPPSLRMSSLSSSSNDTTDNAMPPSPVRMKARGHGHLRSRTGTDIHSTMGSALHTNKMTGSDTGSESEIRARSGMVAGKSKLGRATTISADPTFMIPSHSSSKSPVSTSAPIRQSQSERDSEWSALEQRKSSSSAVDARRKPEPLDLDLRISQLGMAANPRNSNDEGLGWDVGLKRTKSRISVRVHDHPESDTSSRPSSSSTRSTSPKLENLSPAVRAYNPPELDLVSTHIGTPNDDHHISDNERPRTPYPGPDAPSSPTLEDPITHRLRRHQSRAPTNIRYQPDGTSTPFSQVEQFQPTMAEAEADAKADADADAEGYADRSSPSASNSSSSRTPHPLTSRRVGISPSMRSMHRWNVLSGTEAD